MLKSNWFCNTTLHDWLERLASLFHLIGSKTKTNRNLLTFAFSHFAHALHQLRVITWSFDWFTLLSVSFVIGQSDNFE